MVSGSLGLALLTGFLIATRLRDTVFEQWIPYVDGIALLCVGLVILPVPVATTWRAMREVLLVAPDELDRQVQAVMDSIVAERGFISVRIATGFERGPSRMPAIQNRK